MVILRYALPFAVGLLTSVSSAWQDLSSLEQGKRAMAEHDYALAVRWFTEASDQSRTAEAAVLQGEAALLLPDPALAERAARTAEMRDVRNSAARYLLARALQEENHPRESLAAFTAAAGLRPPTGEELRLVALDYVLLNDYPHAWQWLRRAVEMDPHNAESWYSLGRVAFTRGDLPEAQTAFQNALHERPSMVRAQNNLGLVLEASNKVQEALDAYQKAIVMQQDSPKPSEQPYLNRGKLLIEHGAPEEAIAPLRRAVAIAPGDAACREALGRAAAAAGDLPEAEEQMKRAVALQPANPRTHFELGRIYRDAGKTDLAQAEFKTSSQLYGSRSSRDD